MTPNPLTRPSKALISVVWLQLVVGVVGLYLSFFAIHSGALGIEWSNEFRTKFEQARRLPGYQEPPSVQGLSYERVVESLQSAAHQRMDKASYCFGLSGCLSLFAVGELLLIARCRRRTEFLTSGATPLSTESSSQRQL